MVSFLKNHKFLLRGFFALFLFCLTMPLLALNVQAQDSGKDAFKSLENTASEAKITSTLTVQEIVGRIINLALGFLGVIFLVLVIYGGFLWMTASGNEEKVKKGRDLIIHATIGLAIILSAFLLTNFVVFKLADVATTTSSPAGGR